MIGYNSYDKWTSRELNTLYKLASLEGLKKSSLSWDLIAECLNYLFGTTRTGNGCSKKFHSFRIKK